MPEATQYTQPDDGEVLVRVENVSKKFCRDLKKSLWYGVQDVASEVVGRKYDHELRPDEFWAIKDVSFELRRGECLGLVGRNGAGKTTLLRMLNGLIKPDRGRIEMNGRVGALIALGAGFNPILTGRENIYVNASVLGLSKREIDGKVDEIIEFAEIDDFIDSPVQSYSSGMQVRLGFAVATALNPDVLILDEVLAVGDATFRSKCFKRLGSILGKCAVVFVSHDAYSVRRICDRAIWLKSGKQMYKGDVETTMEKYIEDSTELDTGEFFINTADYLADLTCDATVHYIQESNNSEVADIDVKLSFKSEQQVALGFCLGNIMTTDETVVGQFDFKPWFEKILPGYNAISFRISDLRLTKGNYTVALIVFDTTNKELLINIRHLIKFRIEGNIRYGPHYAISTSALPS